MQWDRQHQQGEQGRLQYNRHLTPSRRADARALEPATSGMTDWQTHRWHMLLSGVMLAGLR